MEITNKMWYPASALSNQTWRIHHPEAAWSISAAGECLPAQRYHWGLWIPHIPSLAACACTEHCHPQPAAAAPPGCWDRTHEWAEKGQSAAFACWSPVLYIFKLSLTRKNWAIWDCDFQVLTDHKGSKKTCFFVHVNYVTVADRDKNPVLSLQLEHTTLIDGIKSILRLFGPAACPCTFHEQDGLGVVSQFVNILDQLFGVSDLSQQIRVLVLIFTEAEVNLWVDVIKARLGNH